ncbi:hypothetical protein RPE78_12845 [Thioclava litoralis]|uniref:Apea-like HEPN domain-containing protein n=1 Tax=Thioclava litoralis TaxID=3076557 RepID=A0ABZ1DZZ8_9RHOB|nr:hypothetical protein RPE78_12845 [Thioclava sp. FTW29]
MNNFSLDQVRDIAARAISPIELPPEAQGSEARYKIFKGIPHHEYYLIFLLLVDLLGFKYSGPFEKVAYIIPLGYKGIRYTVAYAKFGMRIECPEDGSPEDVYEALRRGMKAAKSYYLWRAAEASATSNLNLISKCPELWDKYVFLKEQSQNLLEKFEADKDQSVVERGYNEDGSVKWSSISFPAYEFRTQSVWLHEAAVDAFFAWSEQALVHLAVLMGRLKTGSEIADLLKKEFGEKCKRVMDLSEPKEKASYDDILKLRVELRNYVAHGSFGKDGSTFQFHSRVGAVPLKILDGGDQSDFAFGYSPRRDWETDYSRIDRFLETIWSGDRSPAKQYLETGFPCVLTYACDGTYQRAMQSEGEMSSFIDFLAYQMDNAANMDF